MPTEQETGFFERWLDKQQAKFAGRARDFPGYSDLGGFVAVVYAQSNFRSFGLTERFLRILDEEEARFTNAFAQAAPQGIFELIRPYREELSKIRTQARVFVTGGTPF